MDRPSDAAAKILLDLLNAFNLVQHVTESTHTSGLTLDLVITRSSDNIVHDVTTQDPVIADYEAVIFTLHINKLAPVMKTIQYHSFVKTKPPDFNTELENSNLIKQHLNDLQLL